MRAKYSLLQSAFLFSFVALQFSSRAQEDSTVQREKVYKVNPWVSGTISLVGTATNIWAIDNIIHNKKDLTDQELESLRPDILNSFDRWALDLDPSKREKNYKASDYFLPATVAASAILTLTQKDIRKDWKDILLMYYEMHAVTFNIYNFSFFGPNFQNRVRPVAYYDYFSDEERKGGNQRNSMYSGHTASSAASTFFAVKVYSDYHPEIGNKKILLYGLASVPPLVEGYLRVKALAHFPSDNLIGFAIGAACGIIVPELHKRAHPAVELSLKDTPFGEQLALKWNIGTKKKSVLKEIPEAPPVL